MLLTITTTHRPANDLGYLLHKHPERCQSFDLSFGKVHVYYPEVNAERCTACLLLDVDSVLKTGPETVEKSGVHDGLEIDVVTQDARKFFGLLLKKNGYVLEQVLSPLVVYTTPEHAELKEIATQCITITIGGLPRLAACVLAFPSLPVPAQLWP